MSEQSYIEKNDHRITNSKLGDFRFCQMLYKLRYVDKILPDFQNDAMLFGSAFDSILQGSEKFAERYEVVARRSKDAEKKEITNAMKDGLDKCHEEFERQPLGTFDPENSQVEIEVDYKGFKIGGSLDELNLEKKLISDEKTTGSIDTIRKKLDNDYTLLDKYKFQLSFYQFLVQLKHDILCDGNLKILTRPTANSDPRSIFYFASAKSLLDNRPRLIRELDEMIETIKIGIFASSPREKCLKCAAYGKCKYSIQKNYIQF